MTRAPLAQPAPLHRTTLPRNVYRTRRKVFGQWAYFAVTSGGEILGPYRARHYESDAEIVAMLVAELDAVDPVRHLALVREASVPRSTVGALAARTRLLCGTVLSRPLSRPPAPSGRG